MKSSWQQTKLNSRYHFDTKLIDPVFDSVEVLGHIRPTWQQDLEQIISNSRPATWRTRAAVTETLKRSELEHQQEEYDLESIGMAQDYIISNLNHSLPQSLVDLANKFKLDKCSARLHVQHPGQVWNLHIDKLQKWNPEDPNKVIRIMIQLTDWDQGYFWSYGNYTHSGWRAGEVTTFDWQNVPHSTANAGHSPRVTLQLTGLVTEETTDFLNKLKSTTKI